MKAIVIYYSRVGNTEKLAKQIQADISADILKVEPSKDYGNYLSSIARVGKEKRASISVDVKTEVPDLSEYDTVLLGYPIWYSSMPPFMQDFMSKCELNGKIVIPFSTSGATNISSSLDSVKQCCKGASVIEPFNYARLKKDDYSKWIEKVKTCLTK